MNKLLRFGTLFFAAVVVLVSCAKEENEGSDSVEKRILDAYIKNTYNNSIKPTSSGMYVITEKEGTGAKVKSLCGVFVRYSTMDLKHNYLTSTYEGLAKQIGSYSDTTYYGPQMILMGYYTTTRGLEEGLLGMREGGKARFIIPSWLSDYNYSTSTRQNSSTVIYDVEVLKVVDSIPKFQQDTLEAFSKKHYGGMDSLANNFYFKSLSAGIGDTLKTGDAVSVWYVGKLLDGFVFDTNIEDTARKYKIYSSSKTYTALSVTLTDISSTEATVISGMTKALLNMKHGGTAVTFFNSTWGYGSTQKSFGVYQPLFFYIKVVTDDDEDTD